KLAVDLHQARAYLADARRNPSRGILRAAGISLDQPQFSIELPAPIFVGFRLGRVGSSRPTLPGSPLVGVEPLNGGLRLNNRLRRAQGARALRAARRPDPIV